MQAAFENVATPIEIETPTHEVHGHRGRVLLMEDAAHAAKAVEEITTEIEMDVDTAENGRIACILATISLAEQRPYDVILLDMQMPEGSGMEAAIWLRHHEWPGPIIATGVNVSDVDRRQYLAAGCDDFVDRPITDEKLLAAFARLVRQRDEHGGVVPTSVPAPAQKSATPIVGESVKMHGRILVVEDAICIQMIVGGLLQNMGFQVDTAENGQVACDMAVDSLENGHPYDVILMDIQMPKMNGKKAAKWLRDNGWQGPIIAVTIHATDRNREEFLKAGCNGYIAKPITEVNLRNVIAEHVPQA
jgi:two-component system, sensor histidine kinase and response regulator